MTATLDKNPIDDALLIRLGKVVISWSALENWISLLLGTLMGADLAAVTMVTNNVSSAMQIKCIRGLLGVHAHKEPATDRVTQLLERADDLRQERNELVHGIWNGKGCEPKTAIVNTANLERSEIIRDRLITVADLDHLIDDIEDWIRDYATLGAEIGLDTPLPVQWEVGERCWDFVDIAIHIKNDDEDAKVARLNGRHVVVGGQLGRFGSALVEPSIFIEVENVK